MKKIAKILLATASALLVFAAVGCNQGVEIGNIQLDNPVVSAKSEFSANVVTWSPIDNAEKYFVYRQKEVIKKTTDKKGNEVEEKSWSALKLINTISAKDSSEDVKYIDFISVGNPLKEGEKYKYTVEAVRNGSIDSRSVAIEDQIIDFGRGTGSAEVVIAEGNMPAYGSKTPTPTTATATITEKDGSALIQISEDAATVEDVVDTYAILSNTGFNYDDLFAGSDKWGFWDNDDNKWYNTKWYWIGNGVVDIPGIYDINIYNESKANYYYDKSDALLAKTNFEIKAKSSDKYEIPAFKAVVEENAVALTWKISKELKAANPSFTISKYIVNKFEIEESDGTKNYGYSLTSVENSLDTTKLIEEESGITEDGDAVYLIVDTDLKELKSNERYCYILNTKTTDWSAKSLAYANVSELKVTRLTPNDITFVLDQKYTFKKDADGVEVPGSRKYTGEADLIFYGEKEFPKGSTYKATKAKYSKETGLSEETAIELSTLIESTTSYEEKVAFNYTDANLARLNSENYEYYVYRIYVTDKYGITSIYEAKYDNWNEESQVEEYVTFTANADNAAATKNTVSVDIVVTGLGDSVKLSDVTIRALVKYYVKKDITDTLVPVIKVVDITGFKQDSDASDDVIQATKNSVIKDLPKDTSVEIKLFAINSDIETISSSTRTVYSYTLAE